jgi:AraC family transcriptional regulator
MGPASYPDASVEVARLQAAGPPPFIPETLRGETRITGRWSYAPFDAYVPALREHVLVFQFSGFSSASAKTDGRILSARSGPGQIGLIAGGHDGWRQAAGGVEVTNVFLGPARLQACADHLGHARRVDLVDCLGAHDPVLFSIATLLEGEVASERPMQRLFMEQLVDLLCIQLLRAHSTFDHGLSTRRPRGLAAWQVRRVVEHMDAHLAEPIGLDDLAVLVGVGRFHFCSAFKKATGETPHACLVRLRIRRARQLLADPTRRIIDVALEVGYQTPSAFAAVFRQVVGTTPTQYRRGL